MAMPKAEVTGSEIGDPEAMRGEWLDRLNSLASQVKGWAEKSGWRTRLVSRPTNDSALGRIEVPLLLMERDGVEVALNPVSRFVLGADGAVDLYVVPAYDEVAGLYFEGGRWAIYHSTPEADAAGAREPAAVPLSEGALTRVLDEMSARAA